MEFIIQLNINQEKLLRIYIKQWIILYPQDLLYMYSVNYNNAAAAAKMRSGSQLTGSTSGRLRNS